MICGNCGNRVVEIEKKIGVCLCSKRVMKQQEIPRKEKAMAILLGIILGVLAYLLVYSLTRII